ncbi:hypothetical protein CEE69_28265 [Rhodopirellula bahusiensis]|uniref:Uncharacterized protein n=1 Tax=Rhodopirellula bahusiensis TaxID=2014065 RepID=A0A2G1VZW1_9BACT|nr:hypothetical protein CEE69_28265 [Rhodopirellula bahusiensis]
MPHLLFDSFVRKEEAFIQSETLANCHTIVQVRKASGGKVRPAEKQRKALRGKLLSAPVDKAKLGSAETPSLRWIVAKPVVT